MAKTQGDRVKAGTSRASAAPKYYVYALVDPRDGHRFYIGKGCGARCTHHERDVRSGKQTNARKDARIRAILAAGLSVRIDVISRHECESAALEAEAAMIAQNAESLTNIMPHGTPMSPAARRQRAIEINAALQEQFEAWSFEDWRASRDPSPEQISLYLALKRSFEVSAEFPESLAREVVFVPGQQPEYRF